MPRPGHCYRPSRSGIDSSLNNFMSKITIADLELQCHIGVSDEERAKPQRLLVTVEMLVDFSVAVVTDRIEKTINYQEVADEIVKYTQGRSWRLIEKLAVNLGDLIHTRFKPQAVQVEVKKFPLANARHVSATYTKARPR